MHMLKTVFGIAALCAGIAQAQPTITAIQNNYSYTLPGLPNYGIAPGSIFIVKGTNLGPATLVSQPSFPLQRTFNGVTATATVNGQAKTAIPYYVWANQLGLILPSDTPVGDGTLSVSYNNQTASAPIKVVPGAFGILTLNGSGSGTAAVFNANQGGQYVGYTAAANPNEVLTLWGTGLGAAAGDETNTTATPANLTSTLGNRLEVWFGGQRASVQYAGRSQYPGLDQINIIVPTGVTGCYASVVVKIDNIVSNSASIPVAGSGRTCQDTVTGLSGSDLTGISGRDFTMGFVSMGRSASAGLCLPVIGCQPDTSRDDASAWFYRVTPTQTAGIQDVFPQASFNSCVVWTFSANSQGIPVNPLQPTPLDAGTVTITANGQTRQLTRDPQFGFYTVDLGSTPFYAASGGQVSAAGTGGTGVGAFAASLNAPSGFTWLNKSAITTVNRAQGQQVTWSNAAQNSYVEITGSSLRMEPTVITTFTCIAPANAGQFTIPSWVLLSLPPTEEISGISLGSSLSLANYVSAPFSTKPANLDIGNISFFVSSSKSVTYQ